MNVFRAFETSAQGLSAQRTRMNTTSSNIANAETTRTPEGGPYQRREVVLSSVGRGAEEHVFAEVMRSDDTRTEYDPTHPDADSGGFVQYPDISVVEEMVDLISASRAYEAGLTAINTSASIADRALNIGK